MKRKLTTILCADAAGFSGRMSRDEPGTVVMLQRQRAAMEALFERHDGRKVNTWGDAVIAEFSSPVEAVQCAINIQTDLANDSEGADQLVYRIGINLGDVMIDGDDLMGDGVNIAARLQEIAEPGGIAISRSVFDQVNRKLTVRIAAPATTMLKNIDAPVEVYRIRFGDAQWRSAGTDAVFHSDEPQMAVSRQRSARAGPLGEKLHRAMDWYREQNKVARKGIGLVGFLAAINLMTSPGTLWFLWPAIPILALVVFPALSKKDKGRTESSKPAD